MKKIKKIKERFLVFFKFQEIICNLFFSSGFKLLSDYARSKVQKSDLLAEKKNKNTYFDEERDSLLDLAGLEENNQKPIKISIETH